MKQMQCTMCMNLLILNSVEQGELQERHLPNQRDTVHQHKKCYSPVDDLHVVHVEQGVQEVGTPDELH